MTITATELKTNLDKYLMLAETEDIYITKNGKMIAKLSNSSQDRLDIAKSLFGVIPSDVTLEESKKEMVYEKKNKKPYMVAHEHYLSDSIRFSNVG